MLSDVQEQSEGVRLLRRVVDGSISTPLLLVGDEGVGRRFSVISAAKEEFSGGNADSDHCFRISKEAHPDLITVRSDDKGIGVDTIRDVVRLSSSFPSMVPVRYVVIDGADTMTTSASNALLKTLEDPPRSTRFFLLASSFESVIPTIRSRCGLVRYRSLSEKFILSFLGRHTDDNTKALVCTRLSEGSVGRAYQILASGRLSLRTKMFTLLELGLAGDISPLFSTIDDVENDLDQGLRFLGQLIRDLVILPYAPDRVSNLDIQDQLALFRDRLDERYLSRLVAGLSHLRNQMRGSIHLPFHIKTYLVSAFGV
jgi:DNA polymerase-3 subunit delta'